MRGWNSHSDRAMQRAVSQANEMVENVSHYLKNVNQQMRDASRDAEKHLEGAAADVHKHSKQLTNTTTRYIQDHPWTSVGIAVMIGAVISVLFKR